MNDETNAAFQAGTKVGKFRWVICTLLFFAATVNYVDRQVIGILKPTLATEFGWSELDYSWIVFAFQTAYAIGLLFVGKLMDKIGTKIGFAIAITVWSVAAILHAWAPGIGTASAPIVGPIVHAIVAAFNAISSLFGSAPWTFTLSASVVGFMVVRFLLGIGEAGNFPASIKTVAEWFPKKERALATGIFNAGTNVGALVTPLVVPAIVLAWGWYEAFVFTGIIGFIWLAFWLFVYKRPEEHKMLTEQELQYIQSDPIEPTKSVPWRRLFPHRQTWAFGIGKFLTDPIWWVYLFWLPDFLKKQYGLDLSSFGIPLAAIYIIADLGSVGGGYLSSTLIKRGWTINRSQKDGHADMRSRGRTDRLCFDHEQSLGSRDPDRHRRSRPSRLVGEHLHPYFRYVSKAGGRFGGRHWRNDGRGRRDDNVAACRLDTRYDGKLRPDLYHRGIGLPGGVADHSLACTKSGAGEYQLRIARNVKRRKNGTRSLFDSCHLCLSLSLEPDPTDIRRAGLVEISRSKKESRFRADHWIQGLFDNFLMAIAAFSSSSSR